MSSTSDSGGGWFRGVPLMILNAYAVLDAFLSLGRLLVALLLLGLSLPAWRRERSGPEHGSEARGALLFLLAFLLLGLNVASWPLLYLLLQSYIPQWPGVVCIYGVMQVGTGSVGSSRFLPVLVKTLQGMKPALVFVGGAWFVLYALNRRTASGPLRGRLLAVLVLLELLAGVDALVELTYLAIPKKEEFLSAGCCTTVSASGLRTEGFLPEGLLKPSDRAWVWAGYFAGNLSMVLALAACTRWLGRDRPLSWLAPLVVGGVLAVPVSALFLIEIAAPRLLHRPNHHCPYDLFPEVPGAVLSIVLFVGASFAVGWAAVGRWLARCPETEPFLEPMLRRLLTLGMWCYLGSLVILSLELLA
jgi:hypothetical protein